MKVSSQRVTFGALRARGDDGPHDLEAGGVAQGVDDAAVAVAALAGQGELAVLQVELGAPADQVVDLRPGPRGRPVSTTSRSHSPAPATSVSSMWFSKRSSGDSTPAMPPWA